MPACGQWSGFGFSIANNAGDDQVWIIEGRAVRMHKRVAKFAAFVDRSRRFRSNVAGNTVGPAELTEEALDAVAILLNVRIDLGVGAFKIGVRDEPGPAVSRTDHVNHVEMPLSDHAVPVHIEKVETRGRAPVAQQARLHIIERERAFKQWIVFEVYL